MSELQLDIKNFNICRLCLQNKHNLYLLDCNAENDQQFADRALECTGVEIFELSEVPFLVCLNCQAQIDQFYKYRKKVIDNREILHTFVIEYKERKRREAEEEEAAREMAEAEAEARAKAAAEAAVLHIKLENDSASTSSQSHQAMPEPTSLVVLHCPDFKLFESYTTTAEVKTEMVKDLTTSSSAKEPKTISVLGYETYQKDLSSCEICLEVYSNYDNYLQHLKSPKHETFWEQNWRLRPDFSHVLGPNYFAQKANFYKCCICLRNIKRADHYERHISTDEHRAKLEKLRLIYPDKRFDDSRYFNYNLGQVVKIGETKSSNRIYNRKYVCQFCERSFVNSSHLNYHMGSQHESFLPKTLFCEKCNNGFVNQAHYKYHMKRNCPFREGANNQTI